MEGLTISVFDAKGDGGLADVSRIHVLSVRKFIDGHIQPGRVFRRTESEDTIEEGLAYLADADYAIGHDALGYDLPSLEQAYPAFFLPETVALRDTEVLARLLFTDIDAGDYRLIKERKLPGNLLGSHSIEAWAHRLGMHKGDYVRGKEAEAKVLGISGVKEVAAYVWSSWNRTMEAYAVRDVEITVALWLRCLDEIRRRQVPLDLIVTRHRAHELMVRQQRAGFGFDADAARELAKRLKAELDTTVDRAKRFYGRYAAPAKTYQIGEVKKAGGMVKQRPRAHYGEDDTRSSWAEVLQPQRPTPDGKTPGHPYCAIVWKDFDPTKRAQIVNRLTTVHGWEPTVLTESGAVSVADDVLRPLANRWPICEALADVFVLQKQLSAIAGKDAALEDDEEETERSPSKKSSAWLVRYDPSTRGIHHRCVIGATVSMRAAHAGPNIGQVKSIEAAPKDAAPDTVAISRSWSIRTGGQWAEVEKRVLTGMAGGYGYESRGLFGPMPGFAFQTGVDLVSIEMLALGARLAPYDDGEFLAEVLTPGLDPHKRNVIAFGLAEEGCSADELDANKPPAKKCFYSMIYGAGDEELGTSVLPPGTTTAALKARGRDLKATFYARRPAFKLLVTAIEDEARGGFLIGLDGSRLPARKRHALLNLRLQSDGAILATKWMLLVDERLRDRGLTWGVDYTQLAYVHDELQFGSRLDEHAFLIGEVAVEAAPAAGEFYGYGAPISAEAKVGHCWRDTH